MVKIFIIAIVLFGSIANMSSRVLAQASESKPLHKIIPTTLFLSPILDGASIALEWKISQLWAINIYGFKRKSDNSDYYKTKVNENLGEIMLKFYNPHYSNKKFKPFFGPALGTRNIIFDENDRRFIDFPRQNDLAVDVKANSNYIVPLYFGFDYNKNNGFIFEYSVGISFQKSYGNTTIRGPIIPPYLEGLNMRSRFLFGYQF